MWNWKVMFTLDTDRHWSDHDIDELSEQLSEAGLDSDHVEEWLNGIISNVVGRNDVSVSIREV